MKSLFSVLLLLGALLVGPLAQAQSCGGGGGATVCLTATRTADNVTLTWTVVGSISNVQVYRDTDSTPKFRNRLATVGNSTTGYVDASAMVDVPYWYWIKFTVGKTSYYSGAAAAAVARAVGSDLTSLQLSRLMSPGWNLGNSLEAIGGETAWGNPLANQSIMNAVKAAGFKTIRIPVSWKQYADANDNISPTWMARVTDVVNSARNAGLYTIINVHWDGGWMQPTYAKQDEVNTRLAKYWTQIANNFKGYDTSLLFAGTNEVMVDGDYGAPTVEYYTVQNSFNQTFVNAVRATGGNNATRHLIVQGFNTNVDYTYNFATIPSDSASNRLMMEVHYYDSYNFTLNANSAIWQWGSIATDAAATETWANESHVDAQFQKMKSRFVDQGIPVILGEFGAISRTDVDSTQRYRTYWDQYITKSAYSRGLVPIYWDNGPAGNHTMGLFDRSTGAQIQSDLISTIVNAAK